MSSRRNESVASFIFGFIIIGSFGLSWKKRHLKVIFTTRMNRLNSGIKNRYNFFIHTIFLFPIIGTDSVNHAKSWDIKSLIQLPGKSILKILQNFWKCVGGVYMRGRLILKITQSVQLFTLIDFIYKIRGSHLVSCQPTQFQPPQNPFFGRFYCITFFCVDSHPID